MPYTVLNSGDLIETDSLKGMIVCKNENFVLIADIETAHSYKKSKWSNVFSPLSELSNSIYGKFNTKNIINQDNHKISAALFCHDLNITNQWYLPAKNELHLIWKNIYQINVKLQLNQKPEFPTGVFWTSTEFDAKSAYAINFDNGQIIKDYKGKNYKVCPFQIRYFD